MTLKQFIKYFDDMNELIIYDWNRVDETNTDDDDEKADIARLFEGCVFDDNADIILDYLYRKHYVLELNDDGMAVMLFPYTNECNANLCRVQINVRKAKNIFDYIKSMFI